MSKRNWQISDTPQRIRERWPDMLRWVTIRTDEGELLNPDCTYSCIHCGECLGCIRKLYDGENGSVFDCTQSHDGDHHWSGVVREHDSTYQVVKVPHGFIEFRYAPGRTCEIVNIEVESDHRGKGIGRKLLEELFKKMKGRADRVYAITRTENEAAQLFYEACLFRVTGVLRRFYGENDGADAIMYGRGREGPV